MLFIVLVTWIELLSKYYTIFIFNFLYWNSNLIIHCCLFSLLYSFVVFRFYTECLGMKLLRKRDIPEERYTNAFLGYGPEDSHFVIELTYSKTRFPYIFQ